MKKKPDVGFDFVVEWFSKAHQNALRQGKKDSAALWKDGVDYIQYLNEVCGEHRQTEIRLRAVIDRLDAEIARLKKGLNG